MNVEFEKWYKDNEPVIGYESDFEKAFEAGEKSKSGENEKFKEALSELYEIAQNELIRSNKKPNEWSKHVLDKIELLLK